MLNIKLEGSRAYAQHFQFLSFHVLQSFMLNINVSSLMCSIGSRSHKYKYSCAPELLAQHKQQILMCSRASCSTQTSNTHVPQSSRSTKISHQLCASKSTPITWNHIHKTYGIGLRPIYKKNHHVHMQWGLRPNIKINIKIIIIINRHMHICVRSKIQDITSLPA